MKPRFLIIAPVSAALLATLPGCGKIKRGVEQALEKAKSGSESAATPPSAPQAVPQGRPEIRHLSAEEYPAFVATKDRVVVVDFYADWCAPCRTLGPVLERVAGGFGSRVALGKVNVDQAQQLAAQAQVKSIPDVRIFVNGQMVDRFVGALPEEQVRARIDRQLATLPAPPPDQIAPAEPPKPVNPVAPMEKDWLPPGIERR